MKSLLFYSQHKKPFMTQKTAPFSAHNYPYDKLVTVEL